jgi:hypothetical protein
MRYQNLDFKTKMYRCDKCGKDGLFSIINSKHVDYCLPCYRANHSRVFSVETGLSSPFLKKRVKLYIPFYPCFTLNQ